MLFTQPDHCLRSLSDLAKISKEFHKLTSRGTLRRFLSATDDAAKLSGLIRDIDQLVQTFQVSLHSHNHGASSYFPWHSARWHRCD
jgi:hypothetical protein